MLPHASRRKIYLHVCPVELCSAGLFCTLYYGSNPTLPQSSAPIQIFKKNQIGERTMFDNTNTYILRTEIAGGITRYYVSFQDGQAIMREIEVSRPIYLEFLRFIRRERNFRRWDERHTEQSEITDETLYNRAFHPVKSVDETVFDSQRNERLRIAIADLPATQRRRFILYYEFGLTYEQIAEMEGCTKMPVKRSIDRATKKIRELIKNF